MRFVFLVEKPFSIRDCERFGVAELQLNGFDIEVWDIGLISMPKYPRVKTIDHFGFKFVMYSDRNELQESALALGPKDVVLLLAGVSTGQAWGYWWLRRLFFGAPARLISITNGHTPYDKWPNVFLQLQDIWTETLGGIGKVKKIFKLLGLEVANMIGRGLTFFHFRKLDYVFAGASVLGLDSSMIGRKTQLFYIHSLDIDVIMKTVRGNASAPMDNIVYLDSMGPIHPELKAFNISFEMDPERFFALNMRCLSFLQDRLDATSVVAAHPRAIECGLEKYFKPIPVVYNQTAELIARSICVIGEPSLSLGMAAWFKKPIIILAHKSAPVWYKDLVASFHSELGCVVWDVEDEKTWVMPEINTNCYSQYCNRYLKKDRSESGMFWDFVSKKLV